MDDFAVNITLPPYSALHDAPTIDQSAIFQHAIDDLSANYSGSLLLVPPGVYFTPGLLMRGGMRLIGAGRNLTTLHSRHIDQSVVTFATGVHYSALRDMTIIGYDDQHATAPAVVISGGDPVDLARLNIMYGCDGLRTYGVDGLVENCYINGYTRGVLSFGSNRYEDVKFDNGGYPLGCQFAFGQGNTVNGISENHFVMCDFSGNFVNSVLVNDGGQHGAIVTLSAGCVLGRPFIVQNGKRLSMVNCEIGDGSNQDANCQVRISNCVGTNAIITGPNVKIDALCDGISQ